MYLDFEDLYVFYLHDQNDLHSQTLLIRAHMELLSFNNSLQSYKNILSTFSRTAYFGLLPVSGLHGLHYILFSKTGSL